MSPRFEQSRKPMCPWCGCQAPTFGNDGGGERLLACRECGLAYFAARHEKVTYSTRKP